MNVLFVGPVVSIGPSFAYMIFDGKVVSASFPYSRIDQARYARDREAGMRIDTVDDFERVVATILVTDAAAPSETCWA